MLNPLKQFYCDVCGDIIKEPKDGYVIWRYVDGKDFGFKIVHQNKCDKDRTSYPKSMHLDAFLGSDGASLLLSFLSPGPIKINLGEQSHRLRVDLDEFVDLFRRLQIPFYEDARRAFDNADLLDKHCDRNEVGPYLNDSLVWITHDYCTAEEEI